MTVGLLLVFVDTVKELPLTFALRPFDFDTLSVRVYQYASDERLAEALLPALMILVLGLVAAVALVPSLEGISGEKRSETVQRASSLINRLQTTAESGSDSGQISSSGPPLLR